MELRFGLGWCCTVWHHLCFMDNVIQNNALQSNICLINLLSIFGFYFVRWDMSIFSARNKRQQRQTIEISFRTTFFPDSHSLTHIIWLYHWNYFDKNLLLLLLKILLGKRILSPFFILQFLSWFFPWIDETIVLLF